MEKPSRSFASDNNAGVHPEILKAIAAANEGHAVGYGDDAYTESAIASFKRHFGADIEVFNFPNPFDLQTKTKTLTHGGTTTTLSTDGTIIRYSIPESRKPFLREGGRNCTSFKPKQSGQ